MTLYIDKTNICARNNARNDRKREDEMIQEGASKAMREVAMTATTAQIPQGNSLTG
jgi:Cu/Ag efflux pump CusA